MAENGNSMWPEDRLSSSLSDSPLAIMQAEAQRIGVLTDGQVLGEVVTRKASLKLYGPCDHLRHSFYLVAPAVDDYRYELFSVLQGSATFPVTVEYWQDQERAQGDDEIGSIDDFKDAMRAILQSDEAVAVVLNLRDIAQRTNAA